MKKIIFLALLAFTLGLFVPTVEAGESAQTTQTSAKTKTHKKQKKHQKHPKKKQGAASQTAQK